MSPAVPQYPGNLGHPTAGWVFESLMPAVWGALLIVIVVQTVRKRSFSILSLLFLAGTTMFWIEWPADWGSYLVYNRHFRLFDSWTSTWYQTYWKPVGVVFGYGIFFGVAAVELKYLIPAIKRRFSRTNPTLVVIVASTVSFYLLDIAAEKLMTSLGWYSYVQPLGPSWVGRKGSLSFVWPAIPFLGFAICLALLIDRCDEAGFYPNERVFGVARVQAGLRRETLRLVAWIATLNVLIFVFQPLILVVGRILFLHHSAYVP